MSLDTELFSSRPISLEELRHSLPSHSRWQYQHDGGELTYEADGWQLLVGETEPVHPSDVPEDLRDLLPNASHRIDFVLEPVGAPEEAITFTAATLAAVGQTFGCVGHDIRTGALVIYTHRPSR